MSYIATGVDLSEYTKGTPQGKPGSTKFVSSTEKSWWEKAQDLIQKSIKSVADDSKKPAPTKRASMGPMTMPLLIGAGVLAYLVLGRKR